MTKSEEKIFHRDMLDGSIVDVETGIKEQAIEFAEWLNNNWWEAAGTGKGMWVKKRSPWEGGAVIQTKTTKELYELFNQNK